MTDSTCFLGSSGRCEVPVPLFFKHFFLPWCIFRPAVDVTFVQPQMQLWSVFWHFPGAGVVFSGTILAIVLIVDFVPGSVTVLSAIESSSSPALADSGGIFFFIVLEANVGWHTCTTVPHPSHHRELTCGRPVGVFPSCLLSFQAVTRSFPSCQLIFPSSHWLIQMISIVKHRI